MLGNMRDPPSLDYLDTALRISKAEALGSCWLAAFPMCLHVSDKRAMNGAQERRVKISPAHTLRYRLPRHYLYNQEPRLPCESQRRVNPRVGPAPLGLKWLHSRIPRLRSSEAWMKEPDE